MFAKFSVIFLVVFVTLSTRGLDDSQFAKILKYDFTLDSPASYYYRYENSDGQTKEEKGEHADTSDFVVHGSYSYVGSDGATYTVNYYADKDGFHPSGDHIKVPPYTPWPVNQIHQDEPPADSGYVPEVGYLPSSEKPPSQENIPQSGVNHNDIYEIPSTTPQPPRGYIPTVPSVVNINKKNNNYQLSGGGSVFDLARSGFNSGSVGNRYIPSNPSTPAPFSSVKSVTVTPLSQSHVTAASKTVSVATQPPKNGPGRQGRSRNLAAYRKAQNDLYEVIQNSHSNHGVFKNN